MGAEAEAARDVAMAVWMCGMCAPGWWIYEIFMARTWHHLKAHTERNERVISLFWRSQFGKKALQIDANILFSVLTPPCWVWGKIEKMARVSTRWPVNQRNGNRNPFTGCQGLLKRSQGIKFQGLAPKNTKHDRGHGHGEGVRVRGEVEGENGAKDPKLSIGGDGFEGSWEAAKSSAENSKRIWGDRLMLMRRAATKMDEVADRWLWPAALAALPRTSLP